MTETNVKTLPDKTQRFDDRVKVTLFRQYLLGLGPMRIEHVITGKENSPNR